MNSKFPGPCDDIKWGRTELWDVFEAAHVLVDIEPSTDPDPHFEPEADALYKQLAMSVALGYPKIVQQIGNRHLFLPLQMVDWALKKGYPVSGVLQDEVCKTARLHIDRANAEKVTRRASIDIPTWQAKDLWSEDELSALLCGSLPGQQAPTDQARRAVQLAIVSGKLDVILLQTPGSWEHMHTDGKTDRYFKPIDAIGWALNRRGEFPLFPAFSLIPNNGQNSGTVSAPSDPAPAPGRANNTQPISNAGPAWEPGARKLAEQYVLSWRKAGYEPTVADAALFVEGRLSTEGITGKAGKFLDSETIRKALVGITGRKAGERIVNKKIPKNLRETLPIELGAAQSAKASPNQK
jgi:hypothetical protein